MSPGVNGHLLMRSFAGHEGANPGAGLAAVGGVLFGTASSGGRCCKGTIFRMLTLGSGFKVLHHFDGPNGASSFGTLIRSGAVLFGTTMFGGAGESGTVFRIRTDGTGFKVLHHFDGATEGAGPASAPVRFGTVLHGTVTSSAGGYPGGAIWKINTDGTGFQVVHTLSGAEGTQPFAGLRLKDGILYGVTTSGGVHDKGVVYRFTP